MRAAQLYFHFRASNSASSRSRSASVEACAFGFPVSTSIWPCGLIRTTATDSPAAVTARIARVTSCCRNVEGARAIGARKPASRSFQVIQAVADRPKRKCELVGSSAHPLSRQPLCQKGRKGQKGAQHHARPPLSDLSDLSG